MSEQGDGHGQGLTEAQVGRLAAFLATLETDEQRHAAAHEIQQQDPALFHTMFTPGFNRGQEKLQKKLDAVTRELAALKTGHSGVSTDREVQLEQRLATAEAQVAEERRGRVTADLARALADLGVDSTWSENQLEAMWRGGTLAFDTTGALDAPGIPAAEGQSVAAAVVNSLRGRCPPELVRSNADRGSDTGRDRGGVSGATLAARLVPEFQRQRDARVNPLAPTAPPNPLAGTGPHYSSAADIDRLIGSHILTAEAVERGRAARATSTKE